MVAETETAVVKEEPIFRRQVLLPEVEFSGPRPLGQTRTTSNKPISTKGKSQVEVEIGPVVDAKRKEQNMLESIIEAAKQQANEAQRLKEEEEAKAAELEHAKKRKREEREKERARKKEKIKDKEAYDAEKQANKEKRLQKLVGAYVVKAMSKYSKELGHDLFKKHAKEVCLPITPTSKTTWG